MNTFIVSKEARTHDASKSPLFTCDAMGVAIYPAVLPDGSVKVYAQCGGLMDQFTAEEWQEVLADGVECEHKLLLNW